MQLKMILASGFCELINHALHSTNKLFIIFTAIPSSAFIASFINTNQDSNNYVGEYSLDRGLRFTTLQHETN